MNHWICNICGYVHDAEIPLDNCPSCHNQCSFSDVTCYSPERGGVGNLDYQLVSAKLGEIKAEGE
jgi:rubredoxin